MRHEVLFFFLYKPFFGCEKSIARSRLNQNKKYTNISHFALSNTKKKIDAAHFLDARGNEKQVWNGLKESYQDIMFILTRQLLLNIFTEL